MKSIYSFEVYKTKTVTTKKIDGDKEEVVSEDKRVPYKIVLKKPSRSESENAHNYWAKVWSQLVNDGVITKQMLIKAYKDRTGSLIGEMDAQDYISWAGELGTLQTEKIYLDLSKSKGEFTEEQFKQKELVLNSKIFDLQRKIIDFETQQSAVFESTAESIAKTKTIVWLMVNLTYIQEGDGAILPFFNGASLNDKLDLHFELEDSDDDFSKEIIQRAALFWAFWYQKRNITTEELDELGTSLADLADIDI